jgi:hypothetical protein
VPDVVGTLESDGLGPLDVGPPEPDGLGSLDVGTPEPDELGLLDVDPAEVDGLGVLDAGGAPALDGCDVLDAPGAVDPPADSLRPEAGPEAPFGHVPGRGVYAQLGHGVDPR